MRSFLDSECFNKKLPNGDHNPDVADELAKQAAQTAENEEGRDQDGTDMIPAGLTCVISRRSASRKLYIRIY